MNFGLDIGAERAGGPFISFYHPFSIKKISPDTFMAFTIL